MSNDKLIFGKNNTSTIVSIEVHDGYVTVFTEDNKQVRSFNVPHKYWILADKNYGGKFNRLQGDNHYQYICEMDTREKWLNARSFKYKAGYDLYSIFDPKESFMVKNGYTYFKGMKAEDVSVLSFDIETNGFEKNSDSIIYTIANAYRKNGQVERKLFSIDDYNDNMAEMLMAWQKYVLEKDPSVILGHNIYGFDLPFIKHCMDLCEVPFAIGRNGNEVTFNEKPSNFRKDGSQSYEFHNCHIYGRELIDTFFLSIKYDIGRKFDSYGLKPIIKQLGLEKENRVFIDASKISELWEIPEERQRIKDYNLDDVDDSLKLYDKFIPAFFYMTQNVPKSFQQMLISASGSQLNSMFVRGYLQDNKSIAKASESQTYQGGISIGIPGIYKNCEKLDLVSAYPSTILAYRLYDEKKDPDMLLLKFTEFFFEARVKYKKLGKTDSYYKALDDLYKILLNSLYGFLGASGLNYNCPEIAAIITEKCRHYLETAINWATGKDFEYWNNIFKEKTE